MCLLIDRIVRTIKSLYPSIDILVKTNLMAVAKKSSQRENEHKENWLSNIKRQCVLQEQKREQIVLKSYWS